MFTKMNYFVKSLDLMTSPGYRMFHLNGDVKYKSSFGGVVTLMIGCFVLYVALTRAMHYAQF